jgi:uncharacterized protein (TIGR02453 family)
MKKALEFPSDVRPDFKGFSREAFAFLEGLAKNNDRAWFAANKAAYDEEVKFQMECLLAEFVGSRRPAGFPLLGDPARGMFRVHRDVRFARDKSPYKTHAGAVMTRSGTKGDPGILYVHVEPGGCFISAGFYSPERDFLAAWRATIAKRPGEFLDIAAPFGKPRSKYVLRHRGALKTMPRGFQEFAGTPIGEYLKWKHFLVAREIPDSVAQSRKLVDAIAELAEVAMPLLEYGWAVHKTAFEDDPRRHMRSGGED